MNWTKGLSFLGGLVACGALMAYGVSEEVPIGSLSGKVTMKENGRPLPGAMVTVAPIYKGEPDSPIRIRRAETDKDGNFTVKNLVAGDYLVTLSGRAHEMGDHPVRVEEGKRTEKTFPLPPIKPYLEVYASQHVFTPEETPKFTVKGFFEKGDLAFTAYKLDIQKVVAQGTLYSALSPLANPDYRTGKRKDPATMGTKVGTWSQSPQRDIEGVFVEGAQTSAMKEGLYWLDIRGGGLQSGTWVVISKIALVGKRMQGDALAYVTDIVTGKPIAGASISTYVDGAIKPLGSTQADGTLRFAPQGRLMLATVGQSHAFVDLYSSEGDGETIRMASYTDRTIYRPGDTVEFKGIVRSIQGSDYAVPAPGPVDVELRDADDNVLGKQKLATNPMGTYAGRFQIPKEAGPGYYSIQASFNEASHYLGVSVAAYRKPTYTITVRPEQPVYTRGDRVKMRVKAEYYFGGPVPNATVEAYIYRSEFFDPTVYGADYAEAWGSEGEGYGGEYVGEVLNLRTDENGEAVVEFETRPKKGESAEYDFVYSVNVSIADEGGKYFDGSGSVKVLRGDFTLAAEPEKYVVAPNAPFAVTLRAATPDGKPFPGTKVDVTYGTQFWNGKDMEFFKSEHQSVTFDSSGSTILRLTPTRAGSYAIKVQGKDARGNLIATTSYVWVDGVVDANAFQPTRLSLTLDKRLYRPGEVAKAVIQCDKPGGSALVTVEGDKIYWARTVPLDSPSVSVEIPVASEHAPNAFVTVAYIREKVYSDTSETLRIDDPQRKMKIAVTADKERYNPGEIATYTIKTTTEGGQPLPAEVSLAVVDESIYALAEDGTDLLRAFYPRRYNRVESAYSFPDLYLDGEKAPTSIQVRRQFKDTAFWAPQVVTDATGTATVTVPLPDNLTTWRATAYGVSARTEVGKGVSKVLANRDLMVRLETPAFLVGGDEQRVVAVVSNRSGSDAKVNVEFQVQNAKANGELRQTVSVPNGGSESVALMLSPDTPGEALITAKAWVDGGPNDGVESKVAILPHGRTIRERQAGVGSGTVSVKLNKRSTADAHVGRLRVSVAPSLAGTLTQSLDGLIDFPYGCVEQTMSRFMPLLAVSQLMQNAGLPKPRRAGEIPKMVNEGVVRLLRMQRPDGGWGWWEYGDADPFMTAYVLDGLLRAKQAGYTLGEERINNALSWAEKRLKSPLPEIKPVTSAYEKEYQDMRRDREIDDRAYLAWLLAAHGRVASAKAWFASNSHPSSPLWCAYRLRANGALGGDVQAAVGALVKTATDGGAVASWRERFWGVETTARCLEALITASPDHPFVAKAARYLLEQRKGRMWTSTRDTAYALLGLSRYLATTKELNAAGQIEIKLNGQTVGTVVVTSAASQETTLDVPIGNLLAGENELQFVASGVPRVYFATELHQVDVSKDIAPAPVNGLSVERRYYKLSTQRFEDGSVKFAPGKQPVTQVNKGDLIQVQVILTSDRPREFVLIEDPLPAACRVTEREDVDSPADWGWWWDKLQIFDDRIAIFARSIPAGTSTVTYTMRAENPGRCSALPTSVSNMYDPDAVASSGGSTLEVKP